MSVDSSFFPLNLSFSLFLFLFPLTPSDHVLVLIVSDLSPNEARNYYLHHAAAACEEPCRASFHSRRGERFKKSACRI